MLLEITNRNPTIFHFLNKKCGYLLNIASVLFVQVLRTLEISSDVIEMHIIFIDIVGQGFDLLEKIPLKKREIRYNNFIFNQNDSISRL